MTAGDSLATLRERRCISSRATRCRPRTWPSSTPIRARSSECARLPATGRSLAGARCELDVRSKRRGGEWRHRSIGARFTSSEAITSACWRAPGTSTTCSSLSCRPRSRHPPQTPSSELIRASPGRDPGGSWGIPRQRPLGWHWRGIRAAVGWLASGVHRERGAPLADSGMLGQVGGNAF